MQVLFSSGPGSSFDFIFDASFEPLHARKEESDECRMRRKRLEEALRSCRLVEIFDALVQIQLEEERESASMATSHDARLQFELSTLPLTPGLKVAFAANSGASKTPSPNRLWLSIPLLVSLDSLLDASGITDSRERSRQRSQFSLQAFFMVALSSNKTEPEAPELNLHEYQPGLTDSLNR